VVLHGLAAGQGRQRKGDAGGLCKGEAAARAGHSARLRQTARRAAGQGFGLGRVPGRQKGRQRASTGLFCVWSPLFGVFSLCDPAPARPRPTLRRDLVLPDEAGEVRQSDASGRTR
jgi:hypothetical protein